jgi:catechol 2,3-dioxygenase-like lactoylglutathione lyase family enzyme
MKPQGVHHVSINVDDVDAALAFYVEAIGLTVRTDRPDFAFNGAWLNAGSQQVHLIHGQPPPACGQHFAFLVDQLDDVVAELRTKGFDVSDPVPVGPGRQSFLTDPSGNVVELQQPTSTPSP